MKCTLQQKYAIVARYRELAHKASNTQHAGMAQVYRRGAERYASLIARLKVNPKRPEK